MKSKLLFALLLLAPLLPFAAETNAPVKIFGVVLQKTGSGLLVNRQYFPAVKKAIELQERITELNARKSRSLSAERKLIFQEVERLNIELLSATKDAGAAMEQMGTLQPEDEGKTIFFFGYPNENTLVDDDNFSATGFYAGTCEYATVLGANRTIRRYAATQKQADFLLAKSK